MIEAFVDGFTRWKQRLLYPNVRRKDAGYLANVLSEYASFPIDVRRARLPAFEEIERCHAALKRARDDEAGADPVSAVAPDSPDAPDPVVPHIRLQNYMRQVFMVEKAVLQLQDFPALHARAPMLLERFRSVVDAKYEFLKRQHDQEVSSERLLDLWQRWSDPAVTAADREGIETWLRSRLAAVLNDVQWSYAQSQVREELFLSQQIALFGVFFGFGFALLAVFSLPDASCNAKVPLVVMFFGLLGAFTSIMRRMRNDSAQHGGGSENSYKELTALAYGKIGITFSLLFGVIFSLVMLFIFQSGLAAVVLNPDLAATAFPAMPVFAGSEVGVCNSGNFLALRDAELRALGTLMVWSFAAGFIERLVPDALDRLTKAADTRPT